MNLTIEQREDIEKYAHRIAFKTIEIVHDSFNASICTLHEDKFVELMFFEISKIFSKSAEAMREKNLAFENEKLELISMIRNLNLDIEELNEKVNKMENNRERS